MPTTVTSSEARSTLTAASASANTTFSLRDPDTLSVSVKFNVSALTSAQRKHSPSIVNLTSVPVGNLPLRLSLTIYSAIKPTASSLRPPQRLTKWMKGENAKWIVDNDVLHISISIATARELCSAKTGEKTVALASISNKNLFKDSKVILTLSCVCVCGSAWPKDPVVQESSVPRTDRQLHRLQESQLTQTTDPPTPSPVQPQKLVIPSPPYAPSPRRALDFDGAQSPIRNYSLDSSLIVVNKQFSIDVGDEPWVKLFICIEGAGNRRLNFTQDVLGCYGISFAAEIRDPNDPDKVITPRYSSASPKIENVMANEERINDSRYLTVTFDRNKDFGPVPNGKSVKVSSCDRLPVGEHCHITLTVVRFSVPLPTFQEVYFSARNLLDRRENPLIGLDMSAIRTHVQSDLAQPSQSRELKNLIWEAVRLCIAEYFNPHGSREQSMDPASQSLLPINKIISFQNY